MKKLLFSVAIILCCFAANAQSLTINNNMAGDLYFRVIVLQPSTCSPLHEFMQFIIPGNTLNYAVNLSDPNNWNGGNIPGTYDLGFAEVTRDPSCPTLFSWGTANTNTCGVGTEHYEAVKVGTASCSYPTGACLRVTTSATSCSGFSNNDVMSVTYTVVGTAATVDIF